MSILKPSKKLDICCATERVLFAKCVQALQDSGRHFHLYPWRRIPILLYDKQNKQHRLLAELSTQAEDVAQEIIKRQIIGAT